jgi:hypothetical protein
LDALERVYLALTCASPKWKPPWPAEGDKINVYVLDLARLGLGYANAFMSVDMRRVPFIVLPSGSDEPTLQAAMQRASADAVHQATQAFNWSYRPQDEAPSWPWAWFDTATACYMEHFVLPENPESLRFAANWVDWPDVPLDDDRGSYAACMFIRYLVQRFGFGFVARVWTESEKEEKPVVAMQRLLLQENILLSCPDPDSTDLFSSGYALDSYFLRDKGFARDVYERYGERAIAESFALETASCVGASGLLDHLSCRYYRIYPGKKVRAVRTQLEAQALDEKTWIKVQLAEVTNGLQQRRVVPLRRTQALVAANRVSLAAEIEDIADLDHIVVVVTNCGLGHSATHRFGEPSDDGIMYSLEIESV